MVSSQSFPYLRTSIRRTADALMHWFFLQLSYKASEQVWDVSRNNCPLIDLNFDFFPIDNSSSFCEIFFCLHLTQLVSNYLHSYSGQQKRLYCLYNIQSDISERSLFFLADLKDTKKLFNHIFMSVQSTAVHKIIYVCNKNSTKSSIFIVPLKHCFVIEIFSPLNFNSSCSTLLYHSLSASVNP